MDQDERSQGDVEPSQPADESSGDEAGKPLDPAQPAGQAPTTGVQAAPVAEAGKDGGRAISDQPAYSFWLVLAAILVVGLGFTGAIIEYDKPKDVATAMGALTGIVGALVGAYFGVRGATYASMVTRDQRERERHHRDGDQGRHDRDGGERKRRPGGSRRK